MLRDLWLGRIRLVTYDDAFQEAVGDELEVTTSVAALGARKPKRYSLTLPIHGTQTDADPYAAGQRMRRQVRAAIENALARSQGLYLYAFLDPEQNGWTIIGSATIAYGQGGVTLGDYSLVLDEIYRVASPRAYRSARRFDWYDRRLSTTPRDFWGSRYSVDFAALTGGPYQAASSFAWIPPGAVDVTGQSRKALSTAPVFTREGSVLAVVGQPYGTVVNYEQPEQQRHAADVVIYDRQGQGDWTPPYANLILNPSFETGLANVDSSGWYSSAATISATASQALVGSQALQVVTSVGNSGPAVHLAGTYSSASAQFTVTLFMKGAAGGEVFDVYFASLSSGGYSSPTFTATLTTAWQAFTFTTGAWSAAFTNEAMTLVLRAHAASTVYVDGLMAVAAASMPVGYFDGSSPGCAWTGVPHASSSVGPGGWVNAHRNPGNVPNGVPWAISSSNFSFVGSPAVDSPVGDGRQSQDVTGTATNTPASLTVVGDGGAGFWNGNHPVAPGQQVYVEMFVKPLSVPAGAVVQLGVETYGPTGSSGGGVAVAAATMPAGALATAWQRLSATYVVPSDVYLLSAAIVVTSIPNGATCHVRCACPLVCGTQLGTPPATNPPANPGTAYFDGDSRFAGWQGTRGNSPSVRWLHPEDGYGWEEVYGTEQPLTAGDVPVLTNGICRVRAERGQAVNTTYYLALAVDSAAGPAGDDGGGWQERGRWLLAVDSATNYLTWAMLGQCSVAEWTPERAVVRVPFVGTGTTSLRVDLYVTLQRGWSGPRLEVYCPNGTFQGPFADWQPMDTANQLAASPVFSQPAQGGASSLDSLAWQPTGVTEPWVAVTSLVNALPVAYLLHDQDSPQWSVSSSAAAYGTSYPLVQLAFANGSTYASTQLAFSLGWPGSASQEAEGVRNAGSGTTAAVTPAAALTSPPTAPTAVGSTTGGSIPAGTYFYKYSAYNNVGETLPSPNSTSVTLTGTTSSVALTLTAVTGATGYRVWRATSAGGTYSLVGSTLTTAFTDTLAAPAATTTPTANTSGQGASGSSFVTDTQAAATNATLSGTLAALPPGTYAAWARVRGFSGDVLQLRWTLGGAASAAVQSSGALGAAGAVSVSPTSMAWQWVYLGEVAIASASGALTVTGWISGRSAQNPAASNLGVDLVALLPTTRAAWYDGARDQAAQALIDTRVFSEVVQR